MPMINVPAGLETAGFMLGEGELNFLPELLDKFFPQKKVYLVADDNTYKAAGLRVREILLAANIVLEGEYVFPGTPLLHPLYTHSEYLAKLFTSDCVPLAVGSGVINDLVKCASGIRNIKYCCVPTACSVDGYTASGAALSKNGTKQTVKCPAPYAICADTAILKSAPSPMMASGYADLLTKIPAGADWIIADELGEHPIRQDVWELIQGNIRKQTSDCTDFMNIFSGLANTGYAMQMMGDSRPASGAEHLFSHVWEMEGLSCNGQEVSHGFKVGVGLLASTALHEFVLNTSVDELKKIAKPGLSIAEREAEIDQLLIKGCYGDAPKKTAMSKFFTGSALSERRELIYAHWENLQKRLKEQMIMFDGMKKLLSKANCPATPSAIGLTGEQFIHGIKTAQLIRCRYTVLDLLYELGGLDVAIDKKLSGFSEE